MKNKIKMILEPICISTGSNFEQIYNDIDKCSDYIIKCSKYDCRGYNGKEEIMIKLSMTIHVLISRYSFENQENKSYDYIINQCILYLDGFGDIGFIEKQFGRRNLEFGVALVDYKMRH